MSYEVVFETAAGDRYTHRYDSPAAVRGAQRSGYCRSVREVTEQ